MDTTFELFRRVARRVPSGLESDDGTDPVALDMKLQEIEEALGVEDDTLVDNNMQALYDRTEHLVREYCGGNIDISRACDDPAWTEKLGRHPSVMEVDNSVIRVALSGRDAKFVRKVIYCLEIDLQFRNWLVRSSNLMTSVEAATPAGRELKADALGVVKCLFHDGPKVAKLYAYLFEHRARDAGAGSRTRKRLGFHCLCHSTIALSVFPKMAFALQLVGRALRIGNLAVLSGSEFETFCKAQFHSRSNALLKALYNESALVISNALNKAPPLLLEAVEFIMPVIGYSDGERVRRALLYLLSLGERALSLVQLRIQDIPGLERDGDRAVGCAPDTYRLQSGAAWVEKVRIRLRPTKVKDTEERNRLTTMSGEGGRAVLQLVLDRLAVELESFLNAMDQDDDAAAVAVEKAEKRFVKKKVQQILNEFPNASQRNQWRRDRKRLATSAEQDVWDESFFAAAVEMDEVQVFRPDILDLALSEALRKPLFPHSSGEENNFVTRKIQHGTQCSGLPFNLFTGHSGRHGKICNLFRESLCSGNGPDPSRFMKLMRFWRSESSADAYQNDTVLSFGRDVLSRWEELQKTGAGENSIGAVASEMWRDRTLESLYSVKGLGMRWSCRAPKTPTSLARLQEYGRLILCHLKNTGLLDVLCEGRWAKLVTCSATRDGDDAFVVSSVDGTRLMCAVFELCADLKDGLEYSYLLRVLEFLRIRSYVESGLTTSNVSSIEETVRATIANDLVGCGALVIRDFNPAPESSGLEVRPSVVLGAGLLRRSCLPPHSKRREDVVPEATYQERAPVEASNGALLSGTRAASGRLSTGGRGKRDTLEDEDGVVINTPLPSFGQQQLIHERSRAHRDSEGSEGDDYDDDDEYIPGRGKRRRTRMRRRGMTPKKNRVSNLVPLERVLTSAQYVQLEVTTTAWVRDSLVRWEQPKNLERASRFHSVPADLQDRFVDYQALVPHIVDPVTVHLYDRRVSTNLGAASGCIPLSVLRNHPRPPEVEFFCDDDDVKVPFVFLAAAHTSVRRSILNGINKWCDSTGFHLRDLAFDANRRNRMRQCIPYVSARRNPFSSLQLEGFRVMRPLSDQVDMTAETEDSDYGSELDENPSIADVHVGVRDVEEDRCLENGEDALPEAGNESHRDDLDEGVAGFGDGNSGLLHQVDIGEDSDILYAADSAVEGAQDQIPERTDPAEAPLSAGPTRTMDVPASTKRTVLSVNQEEQPTVSTTTITQYARTFSEWSSLQAGAFSQFTNAMLQLDKK